MDCTALRRNIEELIFENQTGVSVHPSMCTWFQQTKSPPNDPLHVLPLPSSVYELVEIHHRARRSTTAVGAMHTTAFTFHSSSRGVHRSITPRPGAARRHCWPKADCQPSLSRRCSALPDPLGCCCCRQRVSVGMSRCLAEQGTCGSRTHHSAHRQSQPCEEAPQNRFDLTPPPMQY